MGGGGVTCRTLVFSGPQPLAQMTTSMPSGLAKGGGFSLRCSNQQVGLKPVVVCGTESLARVD